jgi:hypothetical protein
MSNATTIQTYGVVAEFSNEHSVLKAANEAREAGYTVMEAYSPLPVHGLDEALGRKRSILPWLVFGGGTFGCLGGLFMQYWIPL